jgi:formylglycine-generating enzyme required for sulfatase activity/predicted Ser/Thr protein kinase
MHLPEGYVLLNRYRIEKVLGQGGFGITYLASDALLHRQVAVKELFISGSSTRTVGQTVQSVALEGISFHDFKSKFIREAQELAAIEHRNIVRVYDHFEANNTAYFTMGYVDGKSLQQLITENGTLTAADAVNVINQLMDAVDSLHRRRKLHRDIKPANVMISNRWEVVLIDFGTARSFGDGRTVTSAAFVSPGYSPLEQYGEQGSLDERSDIYSLGATLYFLLTGKKPVEAPMRFSSPLDTASSINTGVSHAVSNAVAKAMQIHAKERYPSIEAFRTALNQTVRDEGGDGTAPIPGPSAIKPEMVLVEGGTFDMGPDPFSKAWSRGEARSVAVTLSAFKIGQYPVTQAQWLAVMGYNPSHFSGCDNCPVENVSWNEVQEFIRKVNQQTGKNYRLPTEAEWEYAARGGNQSKGYRYAGSDDLANVGWFWDNSGIITHDVGQKQANELGIYDMSGNVWEWCEDWKGAYSSSPQTNPKGPSSGSYRVLRGGGWSINAGGCRVSNRHYFSPDFRYYGYGFRLVRP